MPDLDALLHLDTHYLHGRFCYKCGRVLRMLLSLTALRLSYLAAAQYVQHKMPRNTGTITLNMMFQWVNVLC